MQRGQDSCTKCLLISSWERASRVNRRAAASGRSSVQTKAAIPGLGRWAQTRQHPLSFSLHRFLTWLQGNRAHKVINLTICSISQSQPIGRVSPPISGTRRAEGNNKMHLITKRHPLLITQSCQKHQRLHTTVSEELGSDKIKDKAGGGWWVGGYWALKV